MSNEYALLTTGCVFQSILGRLKSPVIQIIESSYLIYKSSAKIVHVGNISVRRSVNCQYY